MTAVTNAPVAAPVRRLVVSLARMSFILSPATAFSAEDIFSMP